MLTDDEKKDKIDNDPDFINAPYFKYSLKELLNKHPDGVSDDRIAKYLMMNESDLDIEYNDIIMKLRGLLK